MSYRKRGLMLLGVLAAGLAGCDGDRLEDTAEAASVELRAPPKIALPPFAGPIAPPPGLEVRLGEDEVTVGDPPVVRVGLSHGSFRVEDLRGGPEGLLVEPLHEALVEMRKSVGDGRLNVLADESTTYRTLTQVLYSSGQAEFDRFSFVLEAEGRRTAAPIEAPRGTDDEGGATAGERADLELFVLDQGFVFDAAPRHRLPWMAQAVTDGVLRPDIPTDSTGAHDFRALERRLRELKRAYPGEQRIVIGMEDDIPFGVLAETMVTAFGSAADPLFSRVMLTRGGPGAGR